MDDRAFLRAIRANPGDPARRLVYADWLEERGDARGEFLRAEVALEELGSEDGRRRALQARLDALRPRIDPAWLAWVDLSDRYTMLWPNDYCRFLGYRGEVGKPLRFVWGGHNQQTRFSFMSVRPGDYIYPLRVHARKVYLIARMRVRVATTPAKYLREHRADRDLIWNDCADEVLAGEGGTPVRLDLEVPPDVLTRWAFRSRKSERTLKHLEEGEMTSAIDFYGIYRLTDRTAEELDVLLSSA
jgi:uncharacterized protein (TIGR02996 family)